MYRKSDLKGVTMRKDDMLKRAIELYEQDRQKDGEIVKESLNELNIPEEYYERAKKEAADKGKRRKQLLMRNFTIILIIIGIPVYLLVINYILPYPGLIDHTYTYNEKTRELNLQVRVLKEGNMDYDLIYELYSPGQNLYDTRTTTIRQGSTPYTFRTQFTAPPESGTWTIVVLAKLRKYGFNKKILGELKAGPF
jgi:hypothetical protein